LRIPRILKLNLIIVVLKKNKRKIAIKQMRLLQDLII